MLYDAVGAGRPILPGGADVFWRAMLANASKMEEPFAAGAEAGAAALFCSEPRILDGGGLPGGVVVASTQRHVRYSTFASPLPGAGVVDVLGGGGAVSFCLNASMVDAGNVWPFSQMSRSFLIFSYRREGICELLF